MKLIPLLSLLFISCSLVMTSNNNHDVFDKIITVMEKKSLNDMNRIFGKPDKVIEPTQDFKFKILKYSSEHIDVYVDINKNKISHLTLFYFKDFDNYVALKKRFKDYEWVEEKILDNSLSDTLSDKYLVKVPTLRMQFEYDNHVPKRKVMWIYFE